MYLRHLSVSLAVPGALVVALLFRPDERYTSPCRTRRPPITRPPMSRMFGTPGTQTRRGAWSSVLNHPFAHSPSAHTVQSYVAAISRFHTSTRFDATVSQNHGSPEPRFKTVTLYGPPSPVHSSATGRGAERSVLIAFFMSGRLSLKYAARFSRGILMNALCLSLSSGTSAPSTGATSVIASAADAMQAATAATIMILFFILCIIAQSAFSKSVGVHLARRLYYSKTTVCSGQNVLYYRATATFTTKETA